MNRLVLGSVGMPKALVEGGTVEMHKELRKWSCSSKHRGPNMRGIAVSSYEDLSDLRLFTESSLVSRESSSNPHWDMRLQIGAFATGVAIILTSFVLLPSQAVAASRTVGWSPTVAALRAYLKKIVIRSASGPSGDRITISSKDLAIQILQDPHARAWAFFSSGGTKQGDKLAATGAIWFSGFGFAHFNGKTGRWVLGPLADANRGFSTGSANCSVDFGGLPPKVWKFFVSEKPKLPFCY